MPNLDKFLSAQEASSAVQDLGSEFALVKNPDYIHPAYECYVLAPKIFGPIDTLVAAVMDMDGTTTTTEALCIHSLEFMVRKMTDRLSREEWSGLDPVADYPYIIGNSTTKHVEYLIQKYAPFMVPEAIKSSYFYASLWSLLLAQDARRISEVKNNIIQLGCAPLLQDPHLKQALDARSQEPATVVALANSLLAKYGHLFKTETFSSQVRAGIDIYYQRYHEILRRIQQGQGAELAGQILGKSGAHLIEPMPGIGIFLALTKGWLGEEMADLYSVLISEWQRHHPTIPMPEMIHSKENLVDLARRFQRQPLKLALVTSSILYEAEIVLSEVFRVLQSQVSQWPIQNQLKAYIQAQYSNYHNVYDGFITASDSSEIRLKPHRDLYSIALHQLGIPKQQFQQVVGFEDSESGTIAIRAAGIGLCVAVPFSDTQHHDLRAAGYVLHAGIPEVLLRHNLFLKTIETKP